MELATNHHPDVVSSPQTSNSFCRAVWTGHIPYIVPLAGRPACVYIHNLLNLIFLIALPYRPSVYFLFRRRGPWVGQAFPSLIHIVFGPGSPRSCWL